jgi:hypothetical protein
MQSSWLICSVHCIVGTGKVFCWVESKFAASCLLLAVHTPVYYVSLFCVRMKKTLLIILSWTCNSSGGCRTLKMTLWQSSSTLGFRSLAPKVRCCVC